MQMRDTCKMYMCICILYACGRSCCRFDVTAMRSSFEGRAKRGRPTFLSFALFFFPFLSFPLFSSPFLCFISSPLLCSLLISFPHLSFPFFSFPFLSFALFPSPFLFFSFIFLCSLLLFSPFLSSFASSSLLLASLLKAHNPESTNIEQMAGA